jgi:putative transposase
LNRSTKYYKRIGESEDDLQVMRLIDEQYLRTPFYGSRKMAHCLGVNRKCVQRLMRIMGLEAIYPRRRTSIPDREHRIYPYLLRGVRIERPDQVWSADITYIPLRCGFAYLVAVMDWYSRYVLSWRLSNTLDAGFCVAALQEALLLSRPEIFNTDQGAQFTSRVFTTALESAEVQISMDGRGRWLDNVFVERLWRAVKYENVYLNDYATMLEALNGLTAYFVFYRDERIHQALDYHTPAELYWGDQRVVAGDSLMAAKK